MSSPSSLQRAGPRVFKAPQPAKLWLCSDCVFVGTAAPRVENAACRFEDTARCASLDRLL